MFVAETGTVASELRPAPPEVSAAPSNLFETTIMTDDQHLAVLRAALRAAVQMDGAPLGVTAATASDLARRLEADAAPELAADGAPRLASGETVRAALERLAADGSALHLFQAVKTMAPNPDARRAELRAMGAAQRLEAANNA